MGDFYDQFKDNINNRPEPEFHKPDWEDMAQRLDDKQKRRTPLPFWWLLGGMFLLFAVSNMWWYGQNVQGQLTNTRETKTVYIYDTIVQKEIIYRTDTIIKTQKIIERITVNAANSNSKISNLALSNRLKNNDFLAFETDFTNENLIARAVSALNNRNDVLNNQQAYSEAAHTFLAEQKIKESNSEIIDLLSGEINFLDTDLFKITDEIRLLKTENRKRYQVQKALHALEPKGFRLGAASGIPFLIGEGIKNEGGVLANLTTEIEFNAPVRLWLSGMFQFVSYETTILSDAYGAPEFTPPDDNLTLKYAKVPQPSLQLAAGMQYYFRNRQKLKPFVGIGIGAYTSYAANITYEYLNPVGSELEFELMKAKTALTSGLYILQTGLEYEGKNNWYPRFGLDYTINSATDSPNLLQIKLGVNRKF